VPLLLLVLLVPVVTFTLMPLILLQRYRAGTARRLARPWVAMATLAAMLFSSTFFLLGAAITAAWVPNAFVAALAGLGAGCLLGLVGLGLTRWEATPRTLHYTPNRWLVLAITLLVSARVLYGCWRAWTMMRAGVDTSFVAAFGVPGSLGAGATVIGYYLAYSLGLRWRIRKWQGRALRGL
jgi:hypothetical protein